MSLLGNIPIGQYIAGHSPIHRLDPRAKLVFAFVFIILIFLAGSLLSFLIVTAVCLIGILLSRLSIMYVLKGLKPALWFIVLTILVQVLTNQQGPLLFSWRFIEIHMQGVQEASVVSARIILLMVIASILTLTTSPIQLTDGLESLFSPLNRFGFPAHELALMMSISLRFIPTLLEETEKIAKAQISRGASFSSGSIGKRVMGIVPLIVPLFVQSFRRAEDLALAMEARGYRGGEGRTKYRKLVWKTSDTGLILILIILSGILMYLRIAV
ncbi:energy-coupling factor transporter transmembrane component T [Aneurinibacillus sp. Ricciae_BoGa-3]|uniref:energy-coupling factor transporter transmembrane component T family protein n=1 Tax=Aneurinibacillus sp. Ricciae_BoGa-3 TaxID=3022697 RepID=UPI00233FEBE3|nr:energy-coupling factor transporter transmembrane component T [Aneurinibacillus sp. Ricciae_BoGa-3]WCK54791.1 energy-coupling factor transporter transmembrane component T [Aneurinibacillus sp. Ricciae_BoGa-3]